MIKKHRWHHILLEQGTCLPHAWFRDIHRVCSYPAWTTPFTPPKLAIAVNELFHTVNAAGQQYQLKRYKNLIRVASPWIPFDWSFCDSLRSLSGKECSSTVLVCPKVQRRLLQQMSISTWDCNQKHSTLTKLCACGDSSDSSPAYALFASTWTLARECLHVLGLLPAGVTNNSEG